jgi:hypothetical protein
MSSGGYGAAETGPTLAMALTAAGVGRFQWAMLAFCGTFMLGDAQVGAPTLHSPLCSSSLLPLSSLPLISLLSLISRFFLSPARVRFKRLHGVSGTLFLRRR